MRVKFSLKLERPHHSQKKVLAIAVRIVSGRRRWSKLREWLRVDTEWIWRSERNWNPTFRLPGCAERP